MNLKEGCAILEISEGTYYEWKKYDAIDVKTKPNPCKKDDYRGLVVLQIVLDHPKWGGERIATELLKECIIAISIKEAISLKKEAIKYIEEHEIRPKKSIRYEFPKVNDVWCMDFKEIRSNGNKYYLFKIIDDKSRYDILSFVVEHATTEVAINLVDAAINVTGKKPLAIKTDRGTQFKVCFDEYLTKIGVEHFKSYPYYAKFNGKIERVFLDVEKNVCENMSRNEEKSEIAEAVIVESMEHNYVRPHKSLDGLTPAEVYFGMAGYIKNKVNSFCENIRKCGEKMKARLIKLVPVTKYINGIDSKLNVIIFE